MKVAKLEEENLRILTELFDYHDVDQMVTQCAHQIRNGISDIFVLYDQGVLLGELHAMYFSEDERYAVPGRRAYLYAFRVREGYQNQGYGTFLMKAVLAALQEAGYSEFTVGVEDDNPRARHMYQSFGFCELLLRQREEYQGDAYEYNLYLKR